MYNWQDIFEYREGYLYWTKPGSGRQLGKPAGSLRQDGYHAINIGKKKYRAHRIIWEMHHGSIPDGLIIDHIDSKPANNRIENLRLVDAQRNATRSVSNSETGWKGVVRRKNRYQAVMQLGLTNLGLGVFDEAEDAAQMYNFVAAEWYGSYARFNEVEQAWLAPCQKSEQLE